MTAVQTSPGLQTQAGASRGERFLAHISVYLVPLLLLRPCASPRTSGWTAQQIFARIARKAADSTNPLICKDKSKLVHAEAAGCRGCFTRTEAAGALILLDLEITESL
ncbi:hypothetical protein KM043_016414 [Ampulex compressa]|nr:hypothetical protein KM043_016414 [Ampulex compressa]